MGLGSDSEPVPVSIMGQGTHLADSMQFVLEYFLLIEDRLTGVYYTGCLFQGENPDAMHLNQFYHIECELQGGFLDGISVAVIYHKPCHWYSTRSCRHHTVREIAGSITHLEALLELYRSHGGSLNRSPSGIDMHFAVLVVTENVFLVHSSTIRFAENAK